MKHPKYDRYTTLQKRQQYFIRQIKLIKKKTRKLFKNQIHNNFLTLSTRNDVKY